MRGMISAILLGASLACSTVSLYEAATQRGHVLSCETTEDTVEFIGQADVLTEILAEFIATFPGANESAEWDGFTVACQMDIDEGRGISVVAHRRESIDWWVHCANVVMERRGGPCVRLNR